MTGEEWWLPIAVCVGVAWLALLVRFWNQGRLLGSRTSGWCALVFAVWTAGVAGLASSLLMPHASRVPPVLVGAVAAWALVSLVGREEERQLQSVPLLKLFTLYGSVLLERLSEQVRYDESQWCRNLAQGFCNGLELQRFNNGVHYVLELRVDVPGRPAARRTQLQQDITELHREAQAAVDKWLKQERALEKHVGDLDEHAVAAAEGRYRDARAQAEQRCCFLLAIAYKSGRRSTDRQILEVKQGIAHDGLDHTGISDVMPGRVPGPRSTHHQP
ncbi:hypothetical protein AB0H82_12300 [Streptomyces sp. NPDC050732]|uniref:hypothetical protein n=1 Tax=Streptomyces sp. NPDC050732 TaxID=3154632 RepID=UPI00342F1953